MDEATLLGGRIRVISTCQNCYKRGRGIRRHHIVPRAKGGTDRNSNRIRLCSLCERFLHSYFGNNNLVNEMDTRDKIISNELFTQFGVFLQHTEMRKSEARRMKSVIKRFKRWHEKWYDERWFEK